MLVPRAHAPRQAEAQLATRTALVEDLENQLRSAGDASTARELNHQLRQMVLVHRQLLRKFAVVDVECSETIMKLQARDQRILELNKQVLRLKEEMREQSEWNALQLAQLRMTHQQQKDKSTRKTKADAAAAAGAVDEDPTKKAKGRVVKPISRSGGGGGARMIDGADNAARAEWDEV